MIELSSAIGEMIQAMAALLIVMIAVGAIINGFFTTFGNGEDEE